MCLMSYKVATLFQRFNNHKCTFSNPLKRKSTALSDYIWSLKDSSTPYHLRWSILTKAQPYKGNLAECRLCSEEALRILFADYTILNRRSELVTSCRHMRLMSFMYYLPP